MFKVAELEVQDSKPEPGFKARWFESDCAPWASASDLSGAKAGAREFPSSFPPRKKMIALYYVHDVWNSFCTR